MSGFSWSSNNQQKSKVNFTAQNKLKQKQFVETHDNLLNCINQYANNCYKGGQIQISYRSKLVNLSNTTQYYLSALQKELGMNYSDFIMHFSTKISEELKRIPKNNNFIQEVVQNYNNCLFKKKQKLMIFTNDLKKESTQKEKQGYLLDMVQGVAKQRNRQENQEKEFNIKIKNGEKIEIKTNNAFSNNKNLRQQEYKEQSDKQEKPHDTPRKKQNNEEGDQLKQMERSIKSQGISAEKLLQNILKHNPHLHKDQFHIQKNTLYMYEYVNKLNGGYKTINTSCIIKKGKKYLQIFNQGLNKQDDDQRYQSNNTKQAQQVIKQFLNKYNIGSKNLMSKDNKVYIHQSHANRKYQGYEIIKQKQHSPIYYYILLTQASSASDIKGNQIQTKVTNIEDIFRSYRHNSHKKEDVCTIEGKTYVRYDHKECVNQSIYNISKQEKKFNNIGYYHIELRN